MNANEIAFGIEFETTIPQSDDTPIGHYHGGVQVPWLPAGWKAERDGSIVPTTPNRKGCEFISPILKGNWGVKEIVSALNKINERGAKVNPTCGLHITVTWDGDAAALARLISLVGNHEKAIYASTGTRKRESARFAKQIKVYGNKEEAKRQCELDRYHLLNLAHLARGKNRIEFRAFAGSTSPLKVVAHLMMVLGLVELAINGKRCADWTYLKPAGTKSPWDRKDAGEGETELNRLFYRLGWTKGHTKNNKVFGVIADAGIPELADLKAELRRLARKYDASPAN